ncbi:FtsX-like permease family protein [Enterococcus lemanii]|uniref:FtsX-like permease family protein n=1 Tax=Enterococcus lemanii TaxID=1159752 RepID=A0ABV9MTR4_9ENTE|nr:FtsX-like permease family protein [Enterococcus lemanii]
MVEDYNLDNIDLLAGEYPEDNSNELLVPDTYVLLTQNSEDFDSMIGTTISLNVRDSNNNDVNQIYLVSGVYNTNYKNSISIEYPIYTSYFPKDYLEHYLTQESYDFYIDRLTVTPATRDFNQNIIKDYDSYVRAVGTANTMMIIKVNSEKNLPEVSNKLEKKYPYYHLVSQRDLKTGDLSAIYFDLVKILVIGSIVIALVTGILISFLNKGYISNRSKELAILYSLGFRKREIAFIITLENSILYSLYTVVAFVLAYLANRIYFSRTAMFQLFLTMFEPFNVLSILLLILLMLIISILWGLNGIQQSNLKKYLNE